MKLVIMSAPQEHPALGWSGAATFVTDPVTGTFALSPARHTGLTFTAGVPDQDWVFSVGFANSRGPFQSSADIHLLPEVGLDLSVLSIGASARTAMFNFFQTRGIDNTGIDTADTVRAMYTHLCQLTEPALTFDKFDLEP